MPQWTGRTSTRRYYTMERWKLTGSHGQRPWFYYRNNLQKKRCKSGRRGTIEPGRESADERRCQGNSAATLGSGCQSFSLTVAYLQSSDFTPQALPCFFTTMGTSDSRTLPCAVFGVSQVPRLLFPHAPSPNTPGSLSAAYECLLTDGYRLQHLWKQSRSHFVY